MRTPKKGPSRFRLRPMSPMSPISCLNHFQPNFRLKNGAIFLLAMSKKIKKFRIRIFAKVRFRLFFHARQLRDNSCFLLVCMERAMNCVLIPCGHLAICIQCSVKLRACPIWYVFVSFICGSLTLLFILCRSTDSRQVVIEAKLIFKS